MENTMDFTKIWEIIKKNWKLLVLLPIVFLLISLVYTFLLLALSMRLLHKYLLMRKKKIKI